MAGTCTYSRLMYSENRLTMNILPLLYLLHSVLLGGGDMDKQSLKEYLENANFLP